MTPICFFLILSIEKKLNPKGIHFEYVLAIRVLMISAKKRVISENLKHFALFGS